MIPAQKWNGFTFMGLLFLQKRRDHQRGGGKENSDSNGNYYCGHREKTMKKKKKPSVMQSACGQYQNNGDDDAVGSLIGSDHSHWAIKRVSYEEPSLNHLQLSIKSADDE